MESVLSTFDLNQLDAAMIVLSAALFFMLWRYMDRAVFTPYIKLIEAREAATDGAKVEAQRTLKLAEEVAKDYEQKVTAARVTLMQRKLEALGKAKSEASEIVKRAESEAQHYTDNFRGDLSKLIASIESKIPQEADALAEELAQKINRESRTSVGG